MFRKWVIGVACVFGFALAAFAGEAGLAINHDQALGILSKGNVRYVTGKPQAWKANAEKREVLTKGQHPVAAIITCSDSRVSPEILFDQTLGDIFVVRLAGNVVTQEAVGSIEYAVAHLHVPLVVVLGHTSCGAVSAAIAEPEAEGPIGSLVSLIKPSIDIAIQKGFDGDDLPLAVVRENARHGAEILMQGSRAIEETVHSGKLAVLSATYDLKSGLVDWQTQLSSPPAEMPVADKASTKSTGKKEKVKAASEEQVKENPTEPVNETSAERIPISTSTPKKSTTKESATHTVRH